MIGASKILTVSYGTFSCTLEGFDDPFNTMKAIAEYFRDLAAEDRYFGAEPPTPDAAMLHKIAEREIHRRVEAKIQDNGVILRAGDDLAPEAPPVPRAGLGVQPGLAAPQTPVFEAPPTQTALPPIMPAPTLADPQPTATETAIADSVAAKLLRIRNAVAQATPAAVAAPETDYSEDQHAADIAEPADFADGGFALDDLKATPVALPEEDAAQLQDMLAADEALPEEFAAEVPAEVEALAEADPEVAEALPALADLPAEAAPMAVEVEAAPTAADDDAALLASLGVLMAPAQTSGDALAEAEAPAEFAGDLADADWPEDDMPEGNWPDESWTDADRDDLDADDLDADDLDAEAYAPDDLGPDLPDLNPENGIDHSADLVVAQDVTTVDLAADLLPGEDALAAETAPVEAMDEAIAAEDMEDLAALDAGPAEAAVPAAPVEDAKPEISEKAQRARARVIKIRRAEPAARVAEAAAPAQHPAPEAAADAATLSAEAEADLQRELAELERDLAPVVPARPVLPARPVSPVRPVRPAAPADQLDETASDAAVNRLIAQTNTEMAGPENRRRLSAIAHLKAAVIATIADRRAGGAPAQSEDARMDPYRSDLGRLVRPAATAVTGERPAPLVLVSEQRIDRKPEALAAPQAANDAGIAPVRPRRVSAGSNLALQQEMIDDDLTEEDAEAEANIFTDTKGFAEFAERLGAQGLPALLEAAAAYTACVQGRPHFSRPHLIRQISAVDPDASYSREDSLRGFGILLRSGKITKIKRGQFALAESSHYLAEARKLLG
ncbi:hypothetical protein [Rhodobacter ferrooxidans]|uniref:Putative CheA signal transduction histidine kinase n=1 Tax=Rhodobacter ferrooxidans TaxID=371731 RepID=C8S065_9RHOB|nr:hypothetical protein [Rhodobacter sp. SW2]EEW25674.1 putative CheA signal transduction histidine kinase [Rhodobacter sp. SW2]